MGAWLAFWVLTGLASPVVEVSGVKKHDAVWAVAGTVRVLPKEDLLVRSRLAGQVADRKSLEASGKSVIGKDEAIASLEAEELDNEIALFKSRYELLKQRMEIGSTVEPEIQSAREDMAVYEELYKTGQFSQSDLDKRRRELEKLERVWYNSRLDDEAALAGLEFELKSRLTRREAMTLKSPIEGYLTETYVIPRMI